MSKTDGLDILVQVNYFLNKDNRDTFENEVIMALPADIDLKVKLAELKEVHKNIQDKNIKDRISHDIAVLQYGIKKTQIPAEITIIEDNGYERKVSLSDVIDFNDRQDRKDLFVLGTFYALLLDMDPKMMLDMPQEILFQFVNAMRKKPYHKYRDICDVAMHLDIAENLKTFLAENPDGEYRNSTTKINVILTTLSRTIAALPNNFASKEEMAAFADSFAKTDIEKRIGDSYSKGKTV